MGCLLLHLMLHGFVLCDAGLSSLLWVVEQRKLIKGVKFVLELLLLLICFLANNSLLFCKATWPQNENLMQLTQVNGLASS